MRVVEETIYKFDELPDRAKDKARDWWRSIDDSPWDRDNLDSIRVFCEHFGVTLCRFSVSICESVDYRTDACNSHFRGRKLKDFRRDYMPTGYWLDCALWESFYDRFKKTGDAKTAFDYALYDGLVAWRKELEYQQSNEYIDDCLIANEYEFTVEGRFYR